MINLDKQLKNIYSLLSTIIDRTNNVIKTSNIPPRPNKLTNSFRVTTHDFGDKTTWYQNSIYSEAVPEITNISAENALYELTVPGPIVNIYSKRLSAPSQYIRKYANPDNGDPVIFTGGLLMADGTFKHHKDFEVKVFKNDVDITNSIVSIDYLQGIITTKNVEYLDADNVIVKYYKVNDMFGSQFILRPYHGVKWFTKHLEIQISKNVSSEIPTIVFEMWFGRDDYDYDFSDPTQQAYNIGYKMGFRSAIDFINVGNEGKGAIPAHGNLTTDTLIFPFYYDRALDVGEDPDTKSNLIRIYTKDDEVFSQTEITTASFYVEESKIIL